MTKGFELNKRRIGLGILFFVILCMASLWIMTKPELVIEDSWVSKVFIKSIGLIGFVYGLLMFYSLLILIFTKKKGIIISSQYLIDYSRYESIGKIEFKEILAVNRIQKYTLEIVLKEPVFQSRQLKGLQKILLFANNWNYKKSIVISTALLYCDRNELEEFIIKGIENSKI